MVNRVYHLDRGFEHLEDKLARLRRRDRAAVRISANRPGFLLLAGTAGRAPRGVTRCASAPACRPGHPCKAAGHGLCVGFRAPWVPGHGAGRPKAGTRERQDLRDRTLERRTPERRMRKKRTLGGANAPCPDLIGRPRRVSTASGSPRSFPEGSKALTTANCSSNTGRPKCWFSTMAGSSRRPTTPPRVRAARGQGRGGRLRPCLGRFRSGHCARCRGGSRRQGRLFGPICRAAAAHEYQALWRGKPAGGAGFRGQGASSGDHRRLCAGRGPAGPPGFGQPRRHLAGRGGGPRRRRDLSGVRPLVRVNVSIVAGDGDRQEVGSAGYGGREGYDGFIVTDKWQHAVERRCARR